MKHKTNKRKQRRRKKQRRKKKKVKEDKVKENKEKAANLNLISADNAAGARGPRGGHWAQLKPKQHQHRFHIFHRNFHRNFSHFFSF